MTDLDSLADDDAERPRLPSDRLPFSRALWFVGFVALLTQPWSDATGCNGGTRRQTGFDLVLDGGLVFPVFFFAFAMVAPMVARVATSISLRKGIEALSFTAALFAAPLVAIVPRFEIVGRRTALWAADAAFALVLVGLLDALIRIISNIHHRTSSAPLPVLPVILAPPGVVPPPAFLTEAIRTDRPTEASPEPAFRD